MNKASPTARLQNLDDLRGLAALSVCLYHLDCAEDSVWLRDIVKHGFYGVHVFFVISGFIMPHTMHRAGYNLGHFGAFILKRLVRLYPPFFASVVLIFLSAWLSSMRAGYQGQAFEFSLAQFLAHLTYAAGILNIPWVNVVYWTLGIEVQYYLLVGLVFPLLDAGTGWKRILVWLCLAGVSFFGGGQVWITSYLPAFMLGMWAFWEEKGIWQRGVGTLIFLATSCLCWLRLGGEGAVVCAVTALFIVWVRRSWFPLRFLGGISYSLYLIHEPLFHYLFRLRDREVPQVNWMLSKSMMLALALVVAWVFYRLFEVPSKAWSSRISYSSKRGLQQAAT